jgi:hypothetical protein
MTGHDNDHQMVHGPSWQVDYDIFLAKTRGVYITPLGLA